MSKIKILDGIRILECTHFHVGEGGTAMLGDLGAEIIKIEQPIHGSRMRGVTSIGDFSVELPQGSTVFVETLLRNKKSLTLDLTKERGRGVLYRLIGKSQVFVTNFLRRSINALGIDYESLSQHNSRLIYVRASGLGARGPHADEGGWDFLGQAESGMMTAMGEPGMPPLVVHVAVADQATCVLTGYGILAGLVALERTGIGQEIDVSILGSAANLMVANVAAALLLGREFPRHDRARAPNPLRNYYRCRDGKWLMFTHAPPDRYWPDFCSATGIEALKDDPRFENIDRRVENCVELVSILDEVFSRKTSEEWLPVLRSKGLIVAPVNTFLDLEKDEQMLENEYIVDFDHPHLGKIKLPGFPVQFSRTPACIESPAPQLGQHTEQVLLDIGGYTWGEIAELRDQKVI